mmetsp:Transcript_53084/g.153081  ORF Transcript_53084/g.153081 Transcript_53084/m.153081 type:complete len:272 (-) Transcript_53084:102-917(-)
MSRCLGELQHLNIRSLTRHHHILGCESTSRRRPVLMGIRASRPRHMRVRTHAGSRWARMQTRRPCGGARDGDAPLVREVESKLLDRFLLLLLLKLPRLLVDTAQRRAAQCMWFLCRRAPWRTLRCCAVRTLRWCQHPYTGSANGFSCNRDGSARKRRRRAPRGARRVQLHATDARQRRCLARGCPHRSRQQRATQALQPTLELHGVPRRHLGLRDQASLLHSAHATQDAQVVVAVGQQGRQVPVQRQVPQPTRHLFPAGRLAILGYGHIAL